MADSLISHKPSERPSSTELLRSEMLPVKIEDETIRQALSGLSDPRSPYHQKMMSALFSLDNQGNGRVKALAWDAKDTVSSEDLLKDLPKVRLKARQRALILEKMQSVFRRHGAEPVRRESLFPRSGYYHNANVFQVLDASGNILQLPYDLTLPYARELAKYPAVSKRVYTFGCAYRDAYSSGPPRVSDEVDFDIAQRTLDEDSVMDEAEILKVIDEIAGGLPPKALSNAFFQLNHGDVLGAVLEFSRVPIAQHAAVKETLSKLGFHQWTWSKVRVELRKLGLADTTLDDLQQFDFRESSVEKAISRLRDLFNGTNVSMRILTKLERGLVSLSEVCARTAELTVHRQLLITPLGSVNAKFYDGLLFQLVLERKSHRIVVAAGGRYDSLIQAHRGMHGISTKSCCGAVGVAISVDAIVAQLMQTGSSGSRRHTYLKDGSRADQLPRRCDVLLDIGTHEAKSVGLRLLASLWANDLSAELSSSSIRGATDDAEHGFVVTLRHEASTTVRVSNTAADGEEVDVPISSLISYLQQELRQEEANKARPPTFTRQTSHHDADRKANVQVLMAQHRSKKSNKYHIVEAAQQRWSEKLDEWKDAPILAVETSDSVLESIKDTKLSDPESWRRAVQGVYLNERQYLAQVQELLASWRKKWTEGEGGREACVFNFRTGTSIYYDVGQ